MSEQVEHIDPYRQRYVTTTLDVTLGLQVTTEIYTPYVYGEPLNVRRLYDPDGVSSIEVEGIITTIIQTISGTGQNVEIIAEGCTSEVAWIEVWRSCLSPPANRFAYTMDCCVVGTVESEVTMGPAFVAPLATNNVVWGTLDGAGNVLPAGTGETNLEWIDIWS